MYDVIIIGSGPTGLTAAIYTTRAKLATLVIAGIPWGGQLMLTTLVENYPGFPDGIMGPELIERFRQQAKRFGAQIVDAQLEKIEFTSSPFTVTADGKKYQGKTVIIATGANTKWLGLPNEQRLIGRGISSCAPCDAFFFKDKKVVVIGGGDSALEEALFLTKFARSVIVVHRRDSLRASKIMQARAFANPKIAFVFNTKVIDVLGEEKVTGVRLNSKLKMQNAKLQFKIQNQDLEVALQELGTGLTSQFVPKVIVRDNSDLVWEMPIDGMFVAIGHIPNSSLFPGIDVDKKGYIKKYTKPGPEAWQYQMATNIDGVFVAGDVYDYQYKQAVTAAGFGCMAAMEVERWLKDA